MDDLDNYTPWESPLCGNDLVALKKAHEKCWLVSINSNLSWFERERAMELLQAGSLVEYEQVRAAWAEVASCLRRPLQSEDICKQFCDGGIEGDGVMSGLCKPQQARVERPGPPSPK